MEPLKTWVKFRFDKNRGIGEGLNLSKVSYKGTCISRSTVARLRVCLASSAKLVFEVHGRHLLQQSGKPAQTMVARNVHQQRCLTVRSNLTPRWEVQCLRRRGCVNIALSGPTEDKALMFARRGVQVSISRTRRTETRSGKGGVL